MTYEELVKLAKDSYGKADAAKVKEHVAIQFNVTGEAAGAFYLEVKDGQVFVEPYEYYDRDVLVTAEDKVLADIISGKLSIEKAYLTKKVQAEGNLKKALLLKDLVMKKEAKKAPAKKAPAKKEAAEKKAPAKKAPAKKAAAKKEDK